MVPHALSPARTESQNAFDGRDGSVAPELRQTTAERHTMIPHTDPDDLHDVICVGFGPASLAIAAALHDSIEFGDLGTTPMPKVVFLEKQPCFRWHAGMQLPGAKMQISWIKDLATLRNPRSSFTFLNYLWTVDRLVQFSNLGTFLPTRLEYEEYMKWVASWFEKIVEYSQECVEIVPQETGDAKPIQSFLVQTRNLKTGAIESRRARHVIISCGGQPNLPSHFPQSNPRVVHSSSYMWAVPKLNLKIDNPYRFVVFGSGQSAAEIFHDLQSRYPNARCTLLIRQAALKPSDDSPFVNETFNPDRVDDVFETANDLRHLDISNDRATNYGVVRLELLEAIYHDLYMQRVKHSDPADWQHHILPFREVTSIEEIDDRIRVHVQNSEPLHRSGSKKALSDIMDADVVVAATGYKRNIHEALLTKAEHLVSHDSADPRRWKVSRNYAVIFKPNTVSEDAGIWLQGSNESTHGLSDTLLSVLSVRAQEVVRSIFNREKTVTPQRSKQHRDSTSAGLPQAT